MGRLYERLSPAEAAVVLQRSVREVRNMLRRGDLVNVGLGRRRGVDPVQLTVAVADRPLAVAVLEAIAAGEVVVERLGLDDRPVSLIESWDAIR